MSGGDDLRAVFVGYTQQAFTGNLAGRSGAHAKCNAELPGSHFCTEWELDQGRPTPVASTAWVDQGNSNAESRFFREPYSASTYTCGGWTSSSASQTFGGAVGRGIVITPTGDFVSSFVTNTDGGCQVTRPLSCCMGGTAVRFRGFTSPRAGNLGGRAGAQAICEASFAGSHMCTDWEIDQAAVRAPIPASGAWTERGNSDPSSRFHQSTSSVNDTYTCGRWTSSSASQQFGGAVGRAVIVTPLGGLESTFVSNTDGGCQVLRPIACCDGYPPR